MIVEGLREQGYVEGRNLALDVRRAADRDQFPRLAQELLRGKPQVIITVSGVAALAMKEATQTVPIVMTASGDAVGQGLVSSLARPGGNVTGLTVIATDLAAKRLQMLRLKFLSVR